MSRLETIDGSNWEEFTGAPAAVLLIGKSDCPACKRWSEELVEFLATDSEWSDVRFGKLLLDQRGLIDFKRANPWVAQIDSLPYNVIYARGERAKEYAGGGVERLENRLRRLFR